MESLAVAPSDGPSGSSASTPVESPRERLENLFQEYQVNGLPLGKWNELLTLLEDKKVLAGMSPARVNGFHLGIDLAFVRPVRNVRH